MARDPLGVQIGAFGEILAVEEPLGMLVQLMPAFVESVERREEGARVSGMDFDRSLVSGTDFPDRVELGVIDRQEPAILVADAQAQRFVKLEALGPGLEARAQPRGFTIRPAWLVDSGKVDQGISEESAGVGVVEGGEGLLQSLSPTAVQIDDRADASRIHLRKITLDPLGRERRLAAAEMVVNIDDREGRFGDVGRLGDQHRLRLPVAEFQLLDVIFFLTKAHVYNMQREGECPGRGSVHRTPGVALESAEGFVSSTLPQLRRARMVRQASEQDCSHRQSRQLPS